MNKKHTRLKPLSLSVFFAMAAMSAHAAQPSPFAAAPNYLTETSSIKETQVVQPFTRTEKKLKNIITKYQSAGVKPNIMLLLDDSQSMEHKDVYSPELGYAIPRFQALQRSLKKSLTDEADYLNKARWGMMLLNLAGYNAPNRWNRKTFTVHLPENNQHSEQENIAHMKFNIIDHPFPHVGMKSSESITGSLAGTGTPFMTRYIDAVAALDKGIQYRCQKNYLIALTDGLPNISISYQWNFLSYEGYKHNKDTDYATGIYSNLGSQNTSSLDYVPFFSLIQLNRRLNMDDAYIDKAGNLNLKKTWHKVFKDQLKSNVQKIANICHEDFYSNKTNRYYHKYFGKLITSPNTLDSIKENCEALKKMPEVVYYPYTGVVDTGIYNASGLFNSQYAKHYSQYYGNKYQFEGIEHTNFIMDSTINNGQTVARWPAIFNDYYRYVYGPIMLQALSEPLHNADLRTEADGLDAEGKPWDGKQNIETYTISFGNDAVYNNIVKGFLENGSSIITLSDGTQKRGFWQTTKEDELTNIFKEIFAHIENQTSDSDALDGEPVETEGQTKLLAPAPIGSQSVSDTSSYTTSAPSTMGGSIANMAASIFLPAGLKSSEMRFYQLNEKDLKVQKDKYYVPWFGDRKALINVDGQVSWTDSILLSNQFFGLNGQDNNEWWRALLPWTIRKYNDDVHFLNLGYRPPEYRVRPTPPASNKSPRNENDGIDERNMGDVLDTPVISAGKNGPDQGNRQEFLVTAANDGMVYLFQSNPNPNAAYPYSLKLNYLPATMPTADGKTHAQLYKDLAHEQYGKDIDHPHLYMINGGITVRETMKKLGNQQIIMVGNLGQGGRGMYALNVGGNALDDGKKVGLHASENEWNTSVPLFETNGNKDFFDTLGFTVSYPQVGRIAAQHSGGMPINGTQSDIYYASFLASGFAYPQKNTQETALYIQDLLGLDVGGPENKKAISNGNKKGKLLAKMTVSNGVNGLASPTLLDVNQDGIYDFAFAGDYGGNMYRFDLRKVNFKSGYVADDAVTRIYEGNPKQPITTAPAISYEKDGRYVIMFGTGSDIYSNDFYDKNQQAIYGIYQRFDTNNRNPVDINDPNIECNGIVNCQAVRADDLLTQTLTTVDVTTQNDTGNLSAQKMRNLTDIEIKVDDQLTHPGWKIDLGLSNGQQDGERVVIQPYTVFNTLMISTRIYGNTQHANCPNWDAPWSEDTKDQWTLVSEDLNANRYEGPWSSWKNVAPTHTDEVKAEGLCAGKTIIQYGAKEQTRTVTYDHVKTYRKECKESSSGLSGWTLSIRAENGGAIKLKGGIGIDFLHEYQNPQAMQTPSNNGFYYAGLFSNSSTNSTFITGSTTVFSKSSTAMNSSGASLNSGSDGDFQAGGSEPKNCFDNDKNYILMSSTGEGLGDSFQVLGSQCNSGFTIRRLSWREIF